MSQVLKSSNAFPIVFKQDGENLTIQPGNWYLQSLASTTVAIVRFTCLRKNSLLQIKQATPSLVFLMVVYVILH